MKKIFLKTWDETKVYLKYPNVITKKGLTIEGKVVIISKRLERI